VSSRAPATSSPPTTSVYTFRRAKSVSGAAPVAWFLSDVGGISDLTPLTSNDPQAKVLKDTEVKRFDDSTVRISRRTRTASPPSRAALPTSSRT